MKKWISLVLCAGLLFALSACGNSSEERQSEDSSTQSMGTNSGTTPEPEEQPQDAPQQSVIAEDISDISDEMADNNAEDTDINAEVPNNYEETGSTALVVYFSWSGNTESVAKEIQRQTGADIFEIVPAEAYTDDYNTLLDVAQEEQRNDARPEIADTIENFSDYDVIYLGFPNWWGDMPMILYTFFDEYDLSGKTLAPFCTSGGSGFSRTLSTMETLEPDAVIAEGLHIRDSAAGNPGDTVTDWLAGIDTAE